MSSHNDKKCINCDVSWSVPVDQCPRCGLRGWMLDASNRILDESVDPRNRLQTVGALIRVNRDCLPSASVQQPAAWRLTKKNGSLEFTQYPDVAEIWKQIGPVDPLYAAPQANKGSSTGSPVASPAGAAPSTEREQPIAGVDYLKLARRIWRDLRHALNDLSVGGRNEFLPVMRDRLAFFKRYLGDTADYKQDFPESPELPALPNAEAKQLPGSVVRAELLRLLYQRYQDAGDTLARKAAWEIEGLVQELSASLSHGKQNP